MSLPTLKDVTGIINKQDQLLPCAVRNRKCAAFLPDLVRVATREELDRRIKAHLNTLFHSKTGNLIRAEKYSKLFDEDVITRLDEAKKRVNSKLKYLNEKLDQCKDMFRGVLLFKNKSR